MRPSRTRTPRAGAHLALLSCRRGPPGLARCPVHGGSHSGGRTGRPDACREPPTAHAFPGAHTLGRCQWGAASARQHDQDGPYAGASCSRRRRVGLPVAGHSQSPPAPAPGKAPHRDPDHQLEGPGPALHTLALPDRHRQPCPSGRGRHGPSMARLHVGHGAAGSRATASLKMAMACQKLARFPTSLGRGAAPVWCHPRRRYEAARYARPSHEAGTNSVRLNFCMAVELSDASGQYA